jgi:hypothetical protein
MTAHAKLAVLTTLREVYSDGLLRFKAKTLQSWTAATRAGLIAAPGRLQRSSWGLLQPARADWHRYGIDKHANTIHTQHLVQHPSATGRETTGSASHFSPIEC